MKFKDIFLSAFEKAKKDTPAFAVTQWAQHIADEIEDDYVVGERTLRDYYNVYKLREGEPVTQPRPHLVEALCKYLGYGSYDAYIKQKSENETVKPDDSHPEKAASERIEVPDKSSEVGEDVIKESDGNTTSDRILLITLWILAIVGVGFTVGRSINSRVENNCMIWVENHYEPTECNGQRGVITLDNETLEGMHELKGLNKCSTFFLPNDEPIVWYDKFHKKITFFTMAGIHPENGRTLRPITQYMIDRYVEKCD